MSVVYVQPSTVKMRGITIINARCRRLPSRCTMYRGYIQGIVSTVRKDVHEESIRGYGDRSPPFLKPIGDPVSDN